MLRYCVVCKVIFGCLKKECVSCPERTKPDEDESKKCPLKILYPRQDITIDICHDCGSEAIREAQEKRLQVC